jgi:O-antigen/teichoic acid export membrane protein
MANQLSRIVMRNSAFGMAAQIAIKVLSFSFSVLIVRHLGAEAYGQYAAVLAFGAVFVFLGDLGLGAFAVREVARWRSLPDGEGKIRELYGNVLTLRLALSVLAALLLIGTAWLTGRPVVMVEAIALGTLGLIMYGVQGTSDSLLAGFERLDISAGTKVLQQLAFVLAGAVALWIGLGYYGLIYANLLGIAILTFSCWRGVRGLGIRAAGAAVRAWPALIRASLPFGVIGFALGLSYKFDSVLLNVFRGDVETGYYNAAYNLIFSVVVVSNVLNTSLYPSLSRQVAADPDALPAICQRALRYLLALALPITFGIFLLAGQVVPLLFTAAYRPAAPVLEILIWVVPLMFTSEFLGYVVVVRRQERKVARAVIASTATNVAANLILVPWLGLYGASVMTVVTEAVLVGQYVWHLRAMLATFDWGRILLRPLAATVGMSAVLFVARDLPIAALIPLGGLVYAGLLLALGGLDKQELEFLAGFGRRPVPVQVVAD